MYRILLNQSGDAGTLAVAQFNLALEAGETDCTMEANEVNALLRSITGQTPQQQEAMLLDTYLSAFCLFSSSRVSPSHEAAFSALCARLFDGMEFPYPLDTLQKIYQHLNAYRTNYKALEEIDTLCALAEQTGEETVLCFLVRREVLNLLLLSAAFLDRLELTRALTNAVKQCPEAVKQEAKHFDGELFSHRIVEGAQ